MNRQDYEQNDRIESNTEVIISTLQLHMNMEEIDTLTTFYEEEILSEEGELNHLKDDKRLKEFFENLIKEEEDIELNKEILDNQPKKWVCKFWICPLRHKNDKK